MTRHTKKRSLFNEYSCPGIIRRFIPHLNSAQRFDTPLRGVERRFFSVTGMKKLSAFALVFFLSFLVIAPSALAADCTQGYLQYSDGTYTNADGTSCTPGANSGTAANASLFTTQGNPQSTGAPSAFVPLAPIPGLTQGVTANQTGLANFFNNLYKYAIGLAAALAVIMIVWGGLEISTQDSISKQGAGREKIYNAIFGLVLVLSPVLVFSIINPAILNLSLNLPALKTTATPVQTAPMPTCTTSLQQNCVPAAPKQETQSATCTPGLYCYARSGGGTSDFVCAAALKDCDYLFKQQQSGGYGGILPTTSCSLCPS